MAPPPGPGGVSNTGTFWTRAFWRRIIQMDDVVMKRAKTTLMRDALSVYLDVRALQRDHGHGRAPTTRADAAYCVVRERERSGEMLVCREKQISETRSRVCKRTCVFDHDDARLSLLGRKEQHRRRRREWCKRYSRRREKRRSKTTGDDRSIDFTHSWLSSPSLFALTTTQRTTNAQSTLEYLGYYYVRKEKKRGRRRL